MKDRNSKLSWVALAVAALAVNLSAIQMAKAAAWTITGSMTTPRDSHTATLLLNGQVLVSGTNLNSAVCDLYDPCCGTWRATGALNTGRFFHPATLLPNGKVLVAGGLSLGALLSSAELYDRATEAWTATGPLNTARYLHTATLLPNGKVLVAGGYSGASISSAELYDPATGTWAATGALNTGRGWHTATLLPNGKVLVAGGGGSPGNSLPSAELYDPATEVWTATGALNTGRSSHTATLLPNGKVLVAGGYSSGNAVSSAELYDPATGTWTATGSMNTPRVDHTGTLLPIGKALIVGGRQPPGVLSSAELYDPATGMWTTTAALNTARTRHTATLLSNGKVLVAGGLNDGLGPLASAELYDSTASAADFWRLDGNNIASDQFLGTINYQALNLKVAGARAFRLEPVSFDVGTSSVFVPTNINVIGGVDVNSVTKGIAGATIAGGGYAGTDTSIYDASQPNVVTANFGAIGGGLANTASGLASVVGGGWFNTASGYSSTVGGGGYGGSGDRDDPAEPNLASGDYATIGGGGSNTASGYASFIGGGEGNTASAYGSAVPGGHNNLALGVDSFAAGHGAQAVNSGSFVWADNSTDAGFSSTADQQFLIRASGGVGINKNNPTSALDVNGTIQGTSPRVGVWGQTTEADTFLGLGNIGVYGTTSVNGGVGIMAYNAASSLSCLLATTKYAGDFAGTVHVGADIICDGTYYGHPDRDSSGNITGWYRLGKTSANDGDEDYAVWDSDERLKREVATLPGALAKVQKLRGVMFHWNEAGLRQLTRNIETNFRSASGKAEDNQKLWDKKRKEKYEKLSKQQIGFIAQEVEKVFPDWVSINEQGYKQIRMEHLNALLVNAIREQQSQIEAQQKEIAELKDTRRRSAADWEARLRKLEKAVASFKQK